MHKTFKWIGLVVATLLVIVVVFHRPIFFRLTRYFIVRAAEQQNLNVEYKIGGSILTNLRITDLQATPAEPGPVERLEIGKLRLEYSLWGLLRKGLPGFLGSAAIADVFAVIDPAKSLPAEKAAKEQSFKFPALIPEELSIENLNFTSRAPGDDLVISDFDLLLHPRREGFLRAQTIQVPGVQTWTNLNAPASYANRNLVLENFDLGPAMQFRRINLDLSKLSADVIAFGLDATLFGGVTTLSGKITDLHETSALTLTAESRNNSLAQASNYFNLEPSLGGTLEELTLVLTGAITKPVTWSGRATIRVADFTRAKLAQPTDAKLLVELSDGKAVVKSMELLQGENKISATARVDLPKTLDGFAQLNATGTLAADLNNVASVSNKAAEGSLAAQGSFAVKNGNPTADLHLSTDHLTLTNGEVSNATATLHLEKEFGQKGGQFWQGLETKISGKASQLRFKNYAVDSAEFDITTDDERVKINNLEAVRADNDVQLSGEFALPNDLAEFDQKQVDFELKVDATDLKQLIVDQTGTALTGNLSLTGKVARKSGTMNGSLSLAGADVQYGGLRIPQISGAIDVNDNVVKIERLRVDLPDQGAITASGTYDLDAPHAYRGELHATSDTLENFEPLLRSFGSRAELGGSLKLDWRGSGTVRPQSHFGAATMVLRDGRYNDFRELGADVSGMYSPELVQVPTFQLRSEIANAAAEVELRDQTLRVNRLLVQQDGVAVLRGDLALPVDLTKINAPAELVPRNGAVAINLESTKLDLAKLPALAKQKLRGAVTASLQADGTISDLRATLEVHARSLHAAAMGKLAGADFDLKLTLADDCLAADATLRQPQIQPLKISGNVPFNLASVIQEGGFDPTAPLNLSVKWPASSLGFVSKLSPAIRYAEGAIALDANVSGTIREPELSGSATIRFPAVRMRNTTIPNISDGRVELRLQDRTLSIARADMKIAGGPLSVTGTIQFDELTRPVLDLRVDGKSVLVVRNDTVTLRTDLDLSLTGPVESARVAGSVGITQSQFLREVELLPIGLPGRPPPPGVPESATTFSIGTPPIRDWTFDVAIKTVDPFKIRGNLASGGFVADLKLGGTGLEPTLDGTASANDFVLSLPFSRLRVTRGTVYFSPAGAVMNPRLDINAVSELRDYRINVYIYGTAEDPQTTFSSQPPLPQEEIIALLATGATFEELTGDANVVAGRAGWLLLQKLYRKVFGGGSDEGENDFLDRFDVSLGPVDPQTGAQSVITRFRIDENWVLIGTTGIGGGVQGRLKYLIRFR